jgi:hypothetical protein
MAKVVSRKTEPLTSLHIIINYDDSTTTDIVVIKNDIVQLEYMSNGTNHTATGRVIESKISSTRGFDNTGTVQVGMLVVDVSSQFKSEVLNISIEDILTITKVVEPAPATTV